MLQLTTGADLVVLERTTQAVARRRLEVADVADRADLPPRILDGHEALEEELVRHVRQDARQAGRRERSLQRAPHIVLDRPARPPGPARGDVQHVLQANRPELLVGRVESLLGKPLVDVLHPARDAQRRLDHALAGRRRRDVGGRSIAALALLDHFQLDLLERPVILDGGRFDLREARTHLADLAGVPRFLGDRPAVIRERELNSRLQVPFQVGGRLNGNRRSSGSRRGRGSRGSRLDGFGGLVHRLKRHLQRRERFRGQRGSVQPQRLHIILKRHDRPLHLERGGRRKIDHRAGVRTHWSNTRFPQL